jgi:hypothetical protein
MESSWGMEFQDFLGFDIPATFDDQVLFWKMFFQENAKNLPSLFCSRYLIDNHCMVFVIYQKIEDSLLS